MDEIRTARLVLRRARLEDAAAMHRILSDPVATRYWSTPPHTELVLTERWMASMVEADLAISDDFIVTRNGQLIGKLGCWKLPEVGYIIAPAHWGQGYASEAMLAFIDRRRTLGTHELLADVDPRNTRSLDMLKRCGFIETHRATGTWQVGDELCDSVYLRLTL